MSSLSARVQRSLSLMSSATAPGDVHSTKTSLQSLIDSLVQSGQALWSMLPSGRPVGATQGKEGSPPMQASSTRGAGEGHPPLSTSEVWAGSASSSRASHPPVPPPIYWRVSPRTVEQVQADIQAKRRTARSEGILVIVQSECSGPKMSGVRPGEAAERLDEGDVEERAGDEEDEEEEGVIELTDSEEEEAATKEEAALDTPTTSTQAAQAQLQGRFFDCTQPCAEVDEAAGRAQYEHVLLRDSHTQEINLHDFSVEEYRILGRLLLPPTAARPRRWRAEAVVGRCGTAIVTWAKAQSMLDRQWLNTENVDFQVLRLNAVNTSCVAAAHGILAHTIPALVAHLPAEKGGPMPKDGEAMPTVPCNFPTLGSTTGRRRPATVPPVLSASVCPSVLSRRVPVDSWQYDSAGRSVKVKVLGAGTTDAGGAALPSIVPITADWPVHPVCDGTGAARLVRCLLLPSGHVSSLCDDDPHHRRYNYDKVRRNTVQAEGADTPFLDISSYDLLLLPVHLRIHWALLAVDIPGKAVHYFDSLLQLHSEQNEQEYERLMAAALRWLRDELLDKKFARLDTSDWLSYIHTPGEGMPQQGNGEDCGVFLCEFARCLAEGRRFNFDQSTMPLARRRIALAIAQSLPDGGGLVGCAAPTLKEYSQV